MRPVDLLVKQGAEAVDGPFILASSRQAKKEFMLHTDARWADAVTCAVWCYQEGLRV